MKAEHLAQNLLVLSHKKRTDMMKKRGKNQQLHGAVVRDVLNL
jgi:hypothetical protein